MRFTMLRVIFTLDCDRCRQSYEKAAVCADPEPLFWETFSQDLKACAALDGWDTEEEIICSACLEADEEPVLERSAIN
jgi:hypothetical protein